ncbi:hypothetical protein IOK49_04220 [Fervidicoccus fontis]|uniref:Site-2 protease family protein n=2 Tax=Fervidicoccus fontis TaxID=683846 RepID=I0A142_FERFK|nr:hypothetical protein [Fervidicoccus fontis]AFH42699.1 hypothetical protein FFONT_0711 [Fervidicoccus fontis Kam940]MBE9391277.1 hypothetical protein [Fervidicoccus fontis]HEW63703.1 hypothetical protein [Fervidicoccus fontis]
MLSKRDNLNISASGITVNLILAIAGLAFSYFFLPAFFINFSIINTWLALFNLIPFGPFDGAKIFKADKRVWVVLFVTSLFLFFYV